MCNRPNEVTTGRECNYLSSRLMFACVSLLQCLMHVQEHETGTSIREAIKCDPIKNGWTVDVVHQHASIKARINCDSYVIVTIRWLFTGTMFCVRRRDTSNGFYGAMKIRVLFWNLMWAISSVIWFGLFECWPLNNYKFDCQHSFLFDTETALNRNAYVSA